MKHLDKEKTEAEKEAAIAALDKKCNLLRAKIKEQEETDVKKEREAVVVPIYICDGCKKDIEGAKQ